MIWVAGYILAVLFLWWPFTRFIYRDLGMPHGEEEAGLAAAGALFFAVLWPLMIAGGVGIVVFRLAGAIFTRGIK